jgi:hypothetical protein
MMILISAVNTISTSQDVLKQLQASFFGGTVTGRNLCTAAQTMSTELTELDALLKLAARGVQNNKTVDILNEECLAILKHLKEYILKDGNSQSQPLDTPLTQIDLQKDTPSGLHTELEGGTQALMELRKAIQDIQSKNDSASLAVFPSPHNLGVEETSGSPTSPNQKKISSMSITKRLSLFKAAAFTNHNVLLYTYAQAGDYHGTKHILEKSQADLDSVFPPLGTALQAAASNGHVSIVELLIAHGASVNILAGKYGTALQAAAYWGRTSCVKALLERGADVDQRGGLFGSALQAAIRMPRWRVEGRNDVIRLLVRSGARVVP